MVTQVAVEILIDLVSDWLFNVLNVMEGKIMVTIISQDSKFLMCLVAAVGSFGSIYAKLARHYKRVLQIVEYFFVVLYRLRLYFDRSFFKCVKSESISPDIKDEMLSLTELLMFLMLEG